MSATLLLQPCCPARPRSVALATCALLSDLLLRSGKRVSADAVANVRRKRGVEHLDRLEAGVLHSLEQTLAGAEQNGSDVEHELVDHAGRERLPHGGGATGDVDAQLARRRLRALEGDVEAVGDEVERRPALHRDRVVCVVGENEHRSVIRRLVAPPPAPVLVPRGPNPAEHVAAHHVRSAGPHQRVARAGVGFMDGLVQVPAMNLPAADAERVLAALIGAGDEAVERDRHVACGWCHVTKTAESTRSHRWGTSSRKLAVARVHGCAAQSLGGNPSEPNTDGPNVTMSVISPPAIVRTSSAIGRGLSAPGRWT